MPITRFLEGIQLDPEGVEVVALAIEKASQSMGLSDRSDPLTEIVARKMIEAARDGERDPARLQKMAIEISPTARSLRAKRASKDCPPAFPNRGEDRIGDTMCRFWWVLPSLKMLIWWWNDESVDIPWRIEANALASCA